MSASDGSVRWASGTCPDDRLFFLHVECVKNMLRNNDFGGSNRLREAAMRTLAQKQLKSSHQPKLSSLTKVSSVSSVATCKGDEMAEDVSSTTSASFAHDFSQVPLQPNSSVALPPKLTVNTPGDLYEQEADRIAEQVIRMPESRLRQGCACDGTCVKCQQRGEEPSHLQRKYDSAHESKETSMGHEVFASPGQPLDAATRRFMEPRFGYDFSRVRVHHGALAAQSAREVDANAYTVGHQIIFAAGRYAPATQAGRRLLAHELTHVVQQSRADRSLAYQSYLERDSLCISRKGARPVSINASPVPQHLLQRDIGFEFQTKNLIIGEKGRKFERKLGKFLHKVPETDKNGVELQTDTGSVAEFETFHFRKWSDLETQIR